jgi:predicted 3-demethylubiquinone-9 3-methyltransferase (glyoxalase superfamily)
MVVSATTVLMFVGEQCGHAREALEFYRDNIPDLTIHMLQLIDDPNDPRVGDVTRAEFTIGDARFIAFDSLPHAFGFTPAVSIMLNFDDRDTLRLAAEAFADGGQTLMPLSDSYGFSQLFAWIDDRYGVSWQLNLASTA